MSDSEKEIKRLKCLLIKKNEVIKETYKKLKDINNQTFDSPRRWRMVLELKNFLGFHAESRE